jgi:hypothetical protein
VPTNENKIFQKNVFSLKSSPCITSPDLPSSTELLHICLQQEEEEEEEEEEEDEEDEEEEEEEE